MFLFLLPFKLYAAETDPRIEFLLKPRFCVLSDKESQCGDQFMAEWKAHETLSVCIFQENDQEPLHCWENSLMGSTEFKLLLNQTTAFELRESTTKKIMARQQFEVLYEQKKYSRNRRNPWSFF